MKLKRTKKGVILLLFLLGLSQLTFSQKKGKSKKKISSAHSGQGSLPIARMKKLIQSGFLSLKELPIELSGRI